MSIIAEESVKIGAEGVVVELTINRPKDLNALNPDTLQSLIIALEKIQKAQSLRVVIITGAGDRAFVAGADIKSMVQLGGRAIADYIELGQRAMRAIETARVPVIAAVNGYALGGGLELALACDMIVASTEAKLGAPEVALGIIPGFGGTQRLMSRCGIGTTRRLVFTGERVSAEEALQLGLVDKVVEHSRLMEEARAVASNIVRNAPLAITRAKEVINRSQEPAILPGLRYEVEAFLTLFGTIDRQEGMEALLQKRDAKFVGK